MDFRFVHAADLHLDTPFKGVGAVEPVVAEALRDASLQAWDALVDLTIESDAAFLLLAGDLYDGAERGLRAQLAFLRGLERLSEHGIATFVVHGNHDPVETGWSAIRDWPADVTVFGTREVTTVPVEAGGRTLATVSGISYPCRDVTENLARRFSRPAGPGFHIGLLHATVGPHAEHATYAPCTMDDLRAAGLDYWALGHIHRRQVVHGGAPWVVYPGNLQGRSPKASERGAKGAYVVEVRNGIAGPPSFAACDRVRFEDVRVPIDALANGLVGVRAALEDAAAATSASAQGRSVVLRGVLEGRGPAHGDLRRPGVLGELLDDLRAMEPMTLPFTWWTALEDRTAAALDLEAIRARGDFTSELLAVGDELAADPEQRRQLAAGWFGDLPLDLRRLLERVPEGVDTALWEDAAAMALDLLVEEGA